MATATDQGIVIPLTAVSDPFGLKPLTSTLLTVNTVPQKSFFINITGSLSNIVIPNNINRPMSASFVVSSATGDPTNNVLIHEVLFSATTSGNLNFPNASISVSITSSFNLNDRILLRLVGNNGSFTTNNIINPTSFNSDLSLNISSIPNPSNTNMVLEPYFEGIPFEGSSADVTSGNIFRNIPNPFLQDIDYNRGPIPVNNQALISGSAERGTVPESYYTSLAQTNIRYKGSKNQSSNFNVYNPRAGTSSFGNPINIGTYGQTPSVSSLDTTIYEFEWGGGTTPEILGYGAVKMGKLLSVSSPQLVKTINPSDGLKNQIVEIIDIPESQWANFGLTGSFTQSRGDYYQILNGNNPVSSRISMFQYGTAAGSNPVLPNTTKIATTEFGVPSISNFMATSSQGTIFDTYGFMQQGSNFFSLRHSQALSKVKSGYIPGGTIPITSSASTEPSVYNTIIPSLNKGERWFVSFYRGFNVGFESQNLVPFAAEGGIDYTLPDEDGNLAFPLAARGVFEIKGIKGDAGNGFSEFYIHPPLPSFSYIGGSPEFSLGFLMWKARGTGKNEFVIVQDEVTGGVSQGAFTSEFVPDYLAQNFETITKEYGSNQTG